MNKHQQTTQHRPAYLWHSGDKIVADGSAVRPAWLLLWGWFASKNVVVVVLASVCG